MIVTGPEVVKWAAERLPVIFTASQGIGVMRSGRMVGAVVYHDYRPRYDSIQLSAVSDGQWLTPKVLREIFYYPFVQLRCSSIYICVAQTNAHARQFVSRVGFKPAGLLRKGFGTVDAVLYDMLPDECRWLRSGHERFTVAAAST